MTRPAKAETTLERSLPANLVQDQKLFWTSPARLQAKDLRWLVPFSMVTAGLIGADHGIESRHLPDNPNTIRRSKSFSNYGAVGFVGSAGAFYLWGRATDNAHMRETGWLSGEALLNSTAIGYAIKGITQRERPLEGNGRGNFWASSSPFNSSFPSEHAIAAWSIASVVAHEYPSPLTQFLAYGAASAVSAARVTGRQHWASDVLIGSALGWYMGRQVYRAHAGGEDRSQWGTFEPAPRETARDPAYMGSPYVPLDSWVYPMFDRLAALGLIKTAFFGLRPWTRLECARLVEEASANRADYGSQSDAMQGIYDALYAEFALERGNLGGERNLGAQIESVYTRFAEIAGPPIRDSYHFGQTIINDYGRPFGSGANIVTGFSSRAVAGPVAFYVRGEYQHAPGAPAYSDVVRNVIAGVDLNPVQPALPISTANQFRLLDSYIAFNVHDLQFSIGKQSLWWGPGQSGPLLLSDNAEPMYMARISQVSPMALPGFLHILGPMRTEFFLAKMSGHKFPRSPYIHGQKVSFKPTPNLEFGFSRTVVLGGAGHPFTMGSFWRSFVSVGDNPSNIPGAASDVGDRKGGFDFSYRIPGLRKWLVIYSDSLTDDDPSPLAAPHRAAFNPGIFLPQIPKIPKLEIRLESAYTDLPVSNSRGGQFVYFNGAYHDSYTNKGFLLGNWIGREGIGLQAWANYWIAPRRTIQVGFRNAKIDNDFIPRGGTLNDFSAKSSFMVSHGMTVDLFFQYERWNIPLLATDLQSNVTASFQFTYTPAWRLK